MECHVCPYWIGYFLINPFRKYVHNPQKILGAFVKPGMNVIDYGCAMGYFSLPMAKMVGESGRVFCFDIQEKMLNKLSQRAKKADLAHIIEPVLLKNDSSFDHEMSGITDFAMLFAVVHEVPDKEMLFNNLYGTMKKDGALLFAEPKNHVTFNEFSKSVSFAEQVGFEQIKSLDIPRSHAVLFRKSE
jgi:ubiquinone/menaquinone biosynthesis C-methylase UbiE